MKNKIVAAGIVMISLALTACKSQASFTPLTDENYALAETQIIFSTHKARIAKETGTNGMGVFSHERQAADPKDHSIVRLNFDTRYSFAIVDLTEPATLIMPETNGRYQSAWIITEEHYNPLGINQPGTYTLTQEEMGSKYIVIALRTMANMRDPEDMAEVSELQDKVQLIQENRGDYVPAEHWNMDEVLAMRKKYQDYAEKHHVTSGMMFGKKKSLSQEMHNCGVACGWGGFTNDQAVYPFYHPTSTEPATLTLKDVPVAENAFWSMTVYDADGYPRGENYNVNSTFAKPNKDGSYTLHFGGDENADNYLEIYEGWGCVLRLYLPQEAYFNGKWTIPELEPVKK